MNSKRYKLIFSKRLNALVVVGENCVSAGKSISETRGSDSSSVVSLIFTRFIGALCLGFVLISTAFADPAANALPFGGVVTQGEAFISQTANNMSIIQTTPKAIVNWQGFDIGAASTVNVLQPNNASVLLSRVVGNNPSQIFGLLNANGQVVLINPNGITFGADGSINASAFTASTLDMHDADFMSDNYRFFSTGANGEIVNQGDINTTGYVALLGANVFNDGVINTNGGNIYLGAGQSVIVPISNSGRIKMELSPASINTAVENTKNGIIVTAGGQVYMQASALNDLVASLANSGQIDTSASQAGDVALLADGGQIKVNGLIKANSMLETNKGGDIIIGRDISTSVLAKSTDVSGAILESGKGFIETSGDFLKADNIKVKAGEWLLDPTNITIAATGTSVSGTAYVANYTAGADSVILASSISSSLNLGTSVTIATSATGASAGNISVNESIAKTAGGDATLTLKAHGNIVVANSKTITSNTGKLNVVLNSDFGGNNSGAIVLNSGSGISSNGGNIVLGGGTAGTGAGAARGNATNPFGISLTGANISAAGGNITMSGLTDQFGAGASHGIGFTESTVSTSGAGIIKMDAWTRGTASFSSGVGIFGSTITGGSSGYVQISGTNNSTAQTTGRLQGVWLDASSGVSSTITSSGGAVYVTGKGGGAASYNYGVAITDGLITSGGSGFVSVTGTGGAGSGIGNAGVAFNGNSLSTGISSSGGTISVTGTAGVPSSEGVWFVTGKSGSIVSGNNANVSVTTDSFVMDQGAINAGSGNVTIQNRTAGTLVNVGGDDVTTGSPLTLGVSNAELNRITAATTKIGSTTAGNLTVSTAITTAATTGNLYLQSNGTATVNTSSVVASGAGLFIQTTGGNIANNSAISGTNITLDNTNGSINTSTGAVTAGGRNCSCGNRYFDRGWCHSHW
jgi:filamentous hemagglutinin family protein